MTRLLTEKEVLHDLRTVGFFNDSATTGTLNGVVAAGDLTVTVQAGEGVLFPAGSVIRIDTQSNICDVATVDSVAVDVLTLLLPLVFGHADTSSVTLLTFVDVGHTTEDGVSAETTQDETPLAAGTQRNTLKFIPGTLEESFNWTMLGFNPENLAQIHGLDETDVSIVVPAEGIQLNPNIFANLAAKPWKAEGIRNDLTPVIWIWANAKVAAVNVTMAWTTGSPTGLPLNARSTGHRSIYIG